MGNFKVGEIVLGQNFVNATEKNGMEGQVVRALTITTSQNIFTGVISTEPMYVISWADGCLRNVRPQNLRRRPAPSGEKSIFEMFSKPQIRDREIA